MHKPLLPSRKSQQAFTLIEMLVVIAIIVLLASVLVPTVTKSIQSARRIKCVSNLRNILLASRMYAMDHKDLMVPSQYTDKTSGGSSNKEFWNSALLEYYNQKENQTHTRQRFSCSEWKKSGPNYTNWNWGYAINDNPGYHESDVNSSKRNARVTLESDGTLSGTFFYLSNITHPTSRLQFCCADAWHVNRNNVEEFPGFNRHGEGKCNVGFFDGHVSVLNKEAILKSVRNP